MANRALIFGITGQDGFYLESILKSKGYLVFGTSRSRSSACHIETMSPKNYSSVATLIKKVRPDEIYNLCGPSSVGESFSKSREYLDSIPAFCSNILCAMAEHSPDSVFINASSVEVFGSSTSRINESCSFNPQSPYATAKTCAALIVEQYRSTFKSKALNAFLGNHESVLRPTKFLSKKVANAVAAISNNKTLKLELGNLELKKDFSHALDISRGLSEMAASSSRLLDGGVRALLFCSGNSIPLSSFVRLFFDHYGLEMEKYVEIKEELKRENEVEVLEYDVSTTKEMLGWQTTIDVKEIVDSIIKNKTLLSVL